MRIDRQFVNKMNQLSLALWGAQVPVFVSVVVRPDAGDALSFEYVSTLGKLSAPAAKTLEPEILEVLPDNSDFFIVWARPVEEEADWLAEDYGWTNKHDRVTWYFVLQAAWYKVKCEMLAAKPEHAPNWAACPEPHFLITQANKIMGGTRKNLSEAHENTYEVMWDSLANRTTPRPTPDQIDNEVHFEAATYAEAIVVAEALVRGSRNTSAMIQRLIEFRKKMINFAKHPKEKVQ